MFPLIVDSIVSGTITVRGSALTTGSNSIIALWRGEPELVDHVHFHVDGYFGAGGITDTLLADNNLIPYQHRWSLAYIVEYGGIVTNAGSVAAEINLMNAGNEASVANLTMTDVDWTWSTILSPEPETLILSRSSNNVEIAVKTAGTGVENLDVEMTIVRM